MTVKTYIMIRNLSVISNVVMWISVGAVYGQTTSPMPEVHHDAVYISLPVFVTSMLATAVFTWTIAKYDNSRIRKIEVLEEKLESMEASMEELEKKRTSRS